MNKRPTPSDDGSNRAFYDADSCSYDRDRWRTKGGAFTNKAQLEILDELCADWIGTQVLEVGPGTGRFTIPLLQKRNSMTLADVSPGMLSAAQRNIERADLAQGVNEYRQCSIYELPFPDASFDHAISLNVFNHLERPGDALKQLARVVRPGSTLLFNYANSQSFYWPMALYVNSRKRAIGQDVYSSWVGPAHMRQLISYAGLELIRIIGHTHVPRAIENYPVYFVVRTLDVLSRRTILTRFAPFHFCLCRKR